MYKVTKSYPTTISLIHSSGDSSPWLSRSTLLGLLPWALGQQIMAKYALTS